MQSNTKFDLKKCSICKKPTANKDIAKTTQWEGRTVYFCRICQDKLQKLQNAMTPEMMTIFQKRR